MPDFKSLTENKYTFNDIFAKASEGWLAVALLCYPLAHIIHILVFTFLNDEALNGGNITDEKATIHFITTAEHPGDYLISILFVTFTLAAVIGFIGIVSKLVSEKSDRTFCAEDSIPQLFMLLFVILAIISVIINGIPRELLLGYTPRGEGFLSLMAYFLFFFIGSLIGKEKVKYIAVYAIMGVGLVNGVMVLVNKYIIDVPIQTFYPLASVYYNINFYGYFLTILILLSAALVLKETSKVRKIFVFVMLCMNSYILALNNTFGCFVACVVAFIFMLVADSILKRKFSISAFVIFIVFLAICLVTSFWYESFFTQILALFTDLKMIITDDENAADAGTLRWGLWTNTMRYIKEKPFIGFGFEGVTERLRMDAGQDKVHNEYLEYAADFGVPACLSYIIGLMVIYIKALVKKSKVDGATFCCLMGAFGYIGSAFFGNTMPFIAPFFFIILGLANTIGTAEKCKDPTLEPAEESFADASEESYEAAEPEEEIIEPEESDESAADEIEITE